ncbi:hypothetical protein RhiirA1_399225 [Rhizophagus irregularis]|uniref:Uncharacterized protein n=1 Tax=Rhizophagus irregularis TaxID=588596 RepID=A0A2I1FIT7_9GLOM|nr:hypothetical protein RhiirA1_399225 [Rhizophagus irregularis]PKY34269.1 hypothetical protein RhiirB3_395435 [Rhizophagus irregularis]
MSKAIEINDDADKIEVDDVDKIDFDKIDVDENDVDKIFDEPHNDIDKVQLKFHQAVKTNNDNEIYKYEIKSLCVSDDKKLAYITCETIRNDNVIATITGEFILYSVVVNNIINEKHKIIWICSTQTKITNGNFTCEWSIDTMKSVKIFDNNKDKNKIKKSNIAGTINTKICLIK